MAQRAQEPLRKTISAESVGGRERLIALEIRASKFGFAVFEGPTRLLDWGVRWFQEKDGALRSTVADRIGTLLRFYRPGAVVVRVRDCHSASKSRAFTMIVSSIRTETMRNSTKFGFVTIRQVREHFAPNGQTTKHGIATNIAKQFEELSWKLPNRRKSYQSEPPTMVIFDAAATGVACFGRKAPSNRGDQPAR
jgi:hypothetical protein